MRNEINKFLIKVLTKIYNNRYNYVVKNNSNNTSYFPGGYNGPHFDIESPVRNTSHFLLFLLKLKKINPNLSDENLENELINWFKIDNKYFQKNVFIQRSKGSSDVVNGVIGSAWLLECFYEVYIQKKDSWFLDYSMKLIDCHKFNNYDFIWYRYDPVIQKYSTDKTFDHQLWYAYARLLFKGIDKNLVTFLENINFKKQIRKNGVFKHVHYGNSLTSKLIFYRGELSKLNNKKIPELEIGYHIYVIQALALINTKIKIFDIIDIGKLNNSFDFLSNFDFTSNSNNKYLFKYNNPLFSMPVINNQFNKYIKCEKIMDEIVKINKEKFLNKKLELINYSDFMTGVSRFYETINYLK